MSKACHYGFAIILDLWTPMEETIRVVIVFDLMVLDFNIAIALIATVTVLLFVCLFVCLFFFWLFIIIDDVLLVYLTNTLDIVKVFLLLILLRFFYR